MLIPVVAGHSQFGLGGRCLIAGLVVVSALPVSGQWVSDQIDLVPGWNSVFLEFTPEPAELDTIFAGQPIKGVYAWERGFQTQEFEVGPRAPGSALELEVNGCSVFQRVDGLSNGWMAGPGVGWRIQSLD